MAHDDDLLEAYQRVKPLSYVNPVQRCSVCLSKNSPSARRCLTREPISSVSLSMLPVPHPFYDPLQYMMTLPIEYSFN